MVELVLFHIKLQKKEEALSFSYHLKIKAAGVSQGSHPGKKMLEKTFQHFNKNLLLQ